MTPYYEHAGITIYHGDCREWSGPADLILADPPYGFRINTTSGSGRVQAQHAGSLAWSGGKYPPLVGSGVPFDPSPWLAHPKVILWGANHYADKLPSSPAWLVWDKREGQSSDQRADCEMAWTNLGGPARLYKQLWRGMIRRGEENGKPRVHPMQKPVALLRWCIERADLSTNSLIVDPYCGSGSALVAAYRTGNRAIGIEIEERYCEIAAKRLQQEVLPLEQPA